MAVAGVVGAGLRVAVVEAAAVVDVRAAGHHVHAFGVGAERDAVGGVVAVAVAAGDVQAVHRVAVQHHGQRVGLGAVVERRRAAAALDGEVVVARGLVVQDRDQAGGAGAERVLLRGVGEAALADRLDVGDGIVRLPLHLVEPAGVAAEQGARGAVGRHAGRAAVGVEVAGTGLRVRGACREQQAEQPEGFREQGALSHLEPLRFHGDGAPRRIRVVGPGIARRTIPIRSRVPQGTCAGIAEGRASRSGSRSVCERPVSNAWRFRPHPYRFGNGER